MTKSIFDPAFKYRPSHDTSVADTFKRVKKELDAEKKRSEEIVKEAETVVAKIRIKGKA